MVAGLRHGHRFTSLGTLDGRYLSTEVAGGFTGRMIGLATDGEIIVRSFSYAGDDILDS